MSALACLLLYASSYDPAGILPVCSWGLAFFVWLIPLLLLSNLHFLADSPHGVGEEASEISRTIICIKSIK
jgi:hypothetical protein